MTKKEIVRTITERLNGDVSQANTKKIVQMTFDAIVDTLETGGRIELRKFGVFEVKCRQPRKARNPRTGDQVDVPAKKIVVFKPGKDLEARINREGGPTGHAGEARSISEVYGPPDPQSTFNRHSEASGLDSKNRPGSSAGGASLPDTTE